MKASDLIEVAIPCTTQDTFKLHKKFKLLKGVDNVYGKWPETLGNGFFIEKKFMADYIIDMVKEKI